MLNVGILGAGTVGTGVINILIEKKQEFEKKIGTPISIKSVAVRNLEKYKDSFPKEIYLTDSPESIVNDPDVNIVVELIGGENPAKDLILQAIRNGKHVITANKEVISKHGQEIFSSAKKHEVLIYIEGSVAGGIPIIQTLKRDLIANKVNSLMGIINGTTNYILTEMTHKKRDFKEVLSEAQKMGFAEADPSSDIEGYDASYKLSILGTLIFSSHVDINQIYREGIDKISLKDIEYASRLGYTIKLLAIAKQHKDGTYEARVHPTMIDSNHPLAAVNGVFNAIWLHGDYVGDFMLYGRGAGQMPTTSAVVADILNMALDIRAKDFANAENTVKHLNLSSMEKVISKYYVRLCTTDKPGVIGVIGRDLGLSEVSINSLWQANTEGDTAEIVLITHPVSEANMNKAIELLKNSDGIKEINSIIRVE